MKNKNIYIYGTVFNTANTIDKFICSLNKLKVKKIYVTDNFSTDGTYEKLSKYKNIIILRKKCSRGSGRELAKIEMLKHVKSKDAVLTLDFDTELTEDAIKYIKESIHKLDHNVFYAIGYLGTAYTHSKVTWHDLMLGDDTEFVAQAISKGIVVKYFNRAEILKLVKDISTVKGKSLKEREYRYASNLFARYARLFRLLVDAERGNAFKSPKEFFNNSINAKSARSIQIDSRLAKYLIYAVYYLAFIVAQEKGIFKYSNELNNIDFIRLSGRHIHEKF